MHLHLNKLTRIAFVAIAVLIAFCSYFDNILVPNTDSKSSKKPNSKPSSKLSAEPSIALTSKLINGSNSNFSFEQLENSFPSKSTDKPSFELSPAQLSINPSSKPSIKISIAHSANQISKSSIAISNNDIGATLLKNYAASNSSDYKVYFDVHTSKYPAKAVGEWLKIPDQSIKYSQEHLRCLDQERQGNCHDADSWKKSKDVARQTRHFSLLENAVVNSPGILAANDPWVWKSNISLYETFNFSRGNSALYWQEVQSILSNKRIHMIGDSLTRQWHKSMYCELVHVVGMKPSEVDKKLFYHQMHVGFVHNSKFQLFTKQDYIIFNFGHHVGWKQGANWTDSYKRLLRRTYNINFGLVPDENIFFRTTTVRHFIQGLGDYDTNSSKAGSYSPNMFAKWSDYGGNTPEQPTQNLIAFDVFLKENNKRKFQILDTSPMMLARGDASFDGSHFCLPGPMEYWSRMLYLRLKVC